MFNTGASGHVVLDENADRDPDYWLWHYKPGEVTMTPFDQIEMTAPKGQVRKIYIVRYYLL